MEDSEEMEEPEEMEKMEEETMARNQGACLVCGRPIIYFERAQKMECVMCHGEFESHASCEEEIGRAHV